MESVFTSRVLVDYLTPFECFLVSLTCKAALPMKPRITTTAGVLNIYDMSMLGPQESCLNDTVETFRMLTLPDGRSETLMYKVSPGRNFDPDTYYLSYILYPNKYVDSYNTVIASVSGEDLCMKYPGYTALVIDGNYYWIPDYRSAYGPIGGPKYNKVIYETSRYISINREGIHLSESCADKLWKNGESTTLDEFVHCLANADYSHSIIQHQQGYDAHEIINFTVREKGGVLIQTTFISSEWTHVISDILSREIEKEQEYEGRYMWKGSNANFDSESHDRINIPYFGKGWAIDSFKTEIRGDDIEDCSKVSTSKDTKKVLYGGCYAVESITIDKGSNIKVLFIRDSKEKHHTIVRIHNVYKLELHGDVIYLIKNFLIIGDIYAPGFNRIGMEGAYNIFKITY